MKELQVLLSQQMARHAEVRNQLYNSWNTAQESTAWYRYVDSRRNLDQSLQLMTVVSNGVTTK
jgi:hypothetical protein